MARKTNKTSHVLDLLTNGSSAEAGDSVSSGTGAAPDKKADFQTHTAAQAKVTVVDEGSRNDRVSQEILSKLSEEINQDTGVTPQEAPSPAQILQPETPIAQPAAQEAPQAQAPVQDTPQASAGETPSAPTQSDAKADEEESYHFINVMEEMLLRQDITDVMKEYNVCTCGRCIADVRALTLTSLPAKYVVTEENSSSPIISYYENRYKIGMLTELVKACTKVREHPHHARK